MEFQKRPAKIVTWEEIEKLAEIITQKIGDFRFDCIVSVIRGGLVPSRIVADYLNIKDIFTLKTEHWGITATPDGKARVTYPIVIDLKGRAVLVVDDITDTGQSLGLALEATRMKNPLLVKSATFLHITKSQIVPDYFGQQIEEEDWRWFVFPWNKREDFRNMVLDCANGGTRDDVISCLLERYDLTIPDTEFEDTISWLRNRKFIKVDGSTIKRI